jgi:penicillin amidase
MINSSEILHRLGRGDRIEAVCQAAGMTLDRFRQWWKEETARRVPPFSGDVRVKGSQARIAIDRDRWGIPHITATDDRDLFLGLGYATAQDRLFQLDFTRRKARGQLAAIMGKSAISSDVMYRTLGLGRIADAEWAWLPAGTRELLTAYAEGINAQMAHCRKNPPIEFDLLNYFPDPWEPADSLAILGEFRWYLTGRFPVICIPEIAKRVLGDGPLYRAFLTGEADDESILLPGDYPSTGVELEKLRPPGAGGDNGGSNNWVLDGSRSISGKPIVASDPHIPFSAVSIWQEVVLRGVEIRAAGVALAGVPAVVIGRTENVAWGITNNICSVRDLYLEKADAAYPGCFLFNKKWEPASEMLETIEVRDADPVHHVVRFSRNGPIVNHLLPELARDFGPVSLRWIGSEYCGWLHAMIATNRAKSCSEFREALRPWVCPTFNLVFADRDGHIGHQTTGRIPVRKKWERGFRPGWEPDHQWQGVIPFDGMPRLTDPPRGFIVTANNRLAPDDYPMPLSGTWNSGHRARRARDLIEAGGKISPDDCGKFQLDTHSGRAAIAVPLVLKTLAGNADPQIRAACDLLSRWDCRIDAHSAAAAVFNVFFAHWSFLVCAERFDRSTAAFVSANAGGLALTLLGDDGAGWLKRDRATVMHEALIAAMETLQRRLGPEVTSWSWGRIHPLLQKHFLSGRGDLGELLDRNGFPAPGDGTTLNSGTPDVSFNAWLGAGYRMVADLADPAAGIWAVEVSGSSGHPGSPHYGDQLAAWAAGENHCLSLSSTISIDTNRRLILTAMS